MASGGAEGRCLIRVLCLCSRRPGHTDPTKSAAVQYMISPITGQQVPVEQMAEHMRIALLDPKWKEKSGLLKPGEKEQTLAEHDEVLTPHASCRLHSNLICLSVVSPCNLRLVTFVCPHRLSACAPPDDYRSPATWQGWPPNARTFSARTRKSSESPRRTARLPTR